MLEIHGTQISDIKWTKKRKDEDDLVQFHAKRSTTIVRFHLNRTALPNQEMYKQVQAFQSIKY